MAGKSPLFQNLENRFNELQTKFIANELAKELQNPLTFQADLDQLAAFKLLVHAEVEDYLERKAKQSLLVLQQSIGSSPFAIRTNQHLFMLASVFEVDLPRDCPFDLPNLKAAFVTLIRTAQDFVANNNGIKERSFMILAILCGKMPDEMDVTLMSMLTQYGKERGDVAHKSTSRVTAIAAPSTEHKNATDLITAVGQFFYGPEGKSRG